MRNSVLIVDEDVNARILAATLLRIRGLHVLAARDGTEACDVVRCEGAAVVVVGLQNCDVGSLELLHILRGQFESFPLPTPRIVVMAGRCEPEAERNALRSSADVFLRKPPEPTQFTAIVERLIGDTDSSAPTVPLC
jgi:CheY-like chemotaxis protein